MAAPVPQDAVDLWLELDDAGVVVAASGSLAAAVRVGCPAVEVTPVLAAEIAAGLPAEGRREVEWWLDGIGEPVYVVARLLRVDGGFVVVGWDATDRQRREAHLSHRAHHDSLTELPNRLAFRARVQEAIDDPGRTDVVVIMIGLTGFKAVNLLAGYRVGDSALAVVADRLVAALPPGSSVARLGGDEFAVLADRTEARGVELGQQIVDAIAEPVDVEGYRFQLRASAGVARISDANDGPSEILRDADLALRRAREDVGTEVALFEPAMYKAIVRRQALRADLEDAVTGGRLYPVYQPVFALESGAVVGVEALARWDDPGRGAVGPDRFVPVAEHTGLIGELGEQMLAAACRDAAAWDGAGWVSVNLSPQQLLTGNRIVDQLADGLATSGLEAHRLTVELTEGAFIADAPRAAALLGEIRSMGIRVALDDFGTGYSSLSYLSSYPVDALKIDRSFVDWVATDEISRRLVEAIIRLGEILELTVVAEGIATDDQLRVLRELGCGYGQGFLLGRPMTREQLLSGGGVGA